MYSELYRYLVLNKRLPIPGIGTFQVERTAARVDFPAKLIHPPSYSITLSPIVENNNRSLYSWIASQMQISEREAVVKLNDFSFELRKKLRSGSEIDWKGIGRLNNDLSGTTKLQPANVELGFLQPVKAEKVLREKAEHMVRVGEEEKTSAEMSKMLALPEPSRSNWWAPALAIGIITIIFIGWYLSQHGVESSSISNKNTLRINKTAVTHRDLQNP